MENDTINMEISNEGLEINTSISDSPFVTSSKLKNECEKCLTEREHQEKVRVSFNFDYTLPAGKQDDAVATFLKVKGLLARESFGSDSRMSFSVNQW